MRRRSVVASLLSIATGVWGSGCFEIGNSASNPATTKNLSEGKLGKDGTDASNRDVDGDGFTVCQERQYLQDAAVGRMDIYVEIDWTEGNRPDQDRIDQLVEVFDTAPVEASRGADPGMNLHILYGDELPEKNHPFQLEDLREYKRKHFDNRGRGYHYALFVSEVAPPAFGRGEDGSVLVQSQIPNSQSLDPIQVFAHELGHTLGLSGSVFDGIDRGSHSFDEYPSIMSYKGMEQDDYLNFSDGTNSERDFDDWGYLEDNLYVPNTDELEVIDSC